MNYDLLRQITNILSALKRTGCCCKSADCCWRAIIAGMMDKKPLSHGRGWLTLVTADQKVARRHIHQDGQGEAIPFLGIAVSALRPARTMIDVYSRA